MSKGKTAWMFPGQGSQFVGMARELMEYKENRNLLKKVEDITNRPIRQYMLEGPKEILDRTSNTQIAVVVATLGAIAVYRKMHQGEEPDFVIGHSLGEIPATVVSGAIGEDDALRLAHERGVAMEAAGFEQPGGMAAILKLEDKTVEELAAFSGSHMANYNIPNSQTVVSGNSEAVERTVQDANHRGGRGISLPISVAAHSPLMQSALEKVRNTMQHVKVQDPIIPMVINKTGEIASGAAELRDSLPEQLTNSVRWAQGIETLRKLGVTDFIEFGPKSVLADIVRRHLAGQDVVVKP